MSRSARATGAAFSPLTMLVLAIVAIVSMAGLGVLSAYAPELKTGDDGGAHALSNASVGFGGIVKLLRATGVPVTLSRGQTRESAGDSLLIATPAFGDNPDHVRDRVNDAERAGIGRVARPGLDSTAPVLIVLPKWNAVPEARRQGWVTTVGPYDASSILAVLPKDLRDETVLNQHEGQTALRLRRPGGQSIGDTVRIDNLQTLNGPSWISVVTDASGGAVVAMRRDTRVYVLSDPDLINTQGLKSLAGARTAVAILDLVRADGSPVIFDLTLHGFQRTRSLLRLMLEPPLLGVTLLLAALVAFAGFQTAVRFGPARETGRTVALGKRALADNTAGLVRLARREHRMASPYALLVRAAVVRAIGAPRTLSDAELNAFLDRVGAMTGVTGRYSALAAAAAAAKTPHDLMSVARDLHRWKQELTHGRQ